MNASLLQKISQAHTCRCGSTPPIIAYAPGRVEILGNHTDYNAGLVISAAIDAGLLVSAAAAPAHTCRLHALDLQEEAFCQLPVRAPLSKPLWANYILGVVSQLNAGREITQGLCMVVAGDLPSGAGLSSSAALTVASALALQALYGTRLSKLELAQLCQAAENEFSGARCGLLDQISSLYGAAQALIYTDFRSLDVATLPLPAEACFLIAHTGVQHSLVESEYNQRRAQCEQATAFFASVLEHPVNALRDVSLEEWQQFAGRLDEVTARRARHIIEENQRVRLGRQQLLAGDLAGFGQLMFQSHQSSRVNFENSCRELDALVDAARELPQALGARLSGGGFGGSVVLLTRSADADRLSQEISARYHALFARPCEIRRVIPSAGARLVRHIPAV